MRYFPTRFIAFLIAGWGCCAVSDGLAQMRFDDITITPELSPSNTSYHGYAEYRIAVSNRSPDKTHRVTLTLPKDSFAPAGHQNRIRKITRSVVVGPSATVHVSLYQPPVLLYGNSLGVAIDGDEQDEAVPLPISRHGRDSGTFSRVSTSSMPPSMGVTTSGVRFPPMVVSTSSPSCRILMSRNVDTTDLHRYANKLLSSPSSGSLPPSRRGGSTAAYEAIDLGFPVSAWSTNWLGFSRYDGIVVTGEDIRQMPPDVHSALWRYVECGGALLVLGGQGLPESWGFPETLGVASDSVGFGQCIVSAETDTKSLNQEQWAQVVDSWLKTALPWRTNMSALAANKRFPVVSGLAVPVRRLFFLMLLFALAIGPVNLIVLSRKKRRIWMLLTIPLISLMTCLAVFGYATVGEGLTRHVRTEGLTLLDERVNRATTIGWTAFYSALTPGDGLHFGYETELTPQIFSTTSSPRTVDWTHNQHLASGWVLARVPAHFMVRKSEVRRERVTVRRRANARLSIVNGLGADISQFWLADKDRALYSATGILAGSEAELVSRKDLRLGGTDDIFLFEIYDPLLPRELNSGNIPPVLRDEMKTRDVFLSNEVAIFVEEHGKRWRIIDRLWGRAYNIQTSGANMPLRVHREVEASLREVFASRDWIDNFERLKIAPEKYLRPGCYIALLDSSPFIEDGLRKAMEKRYSAIVYGILSEE